MNRKGLWKVSGQALSARCLGRPYLQGVWAGIICKVSGVYEEGCFDQKKFGIMVHKRSWVHKKFWVQISLSLKKF